MGGRRFLYFIFLHILHLSSVCEGQYNCQVEKKYSGEIYYSNKYNDNKCWKIEVPDNFYLRLNVKQLSSNYYNSYGGSSCSYGSVKIRVSVTGEEYIFCSSDENRRPVIALNGVNITYSANGYQLTFRIEYNIKELICAQKDHFRCSNHSCIHQHEVCDGVKNCENGIDEKGCETGVTAVSGVNISRENSITWLRGQRSSSFGWGRNTHRAITALYLSGAADFGGDNMEEELMAKQLELQTSVALLRNFTDPLSVSELSMFVNALTVTCHNPRQFYGYNLLHILEERLMASKSPNPGAYLTLCSSNLTFSHGHIQILLRILQKHSEYPFHSDVKAMAIMALSCMRNKTKNFETIQNASKLYNSTVQKFIDSQLHDGSFGNVYTTALITQALLASGQENNKLWKLNSTIKYLMKELNSSADFLSTYLALPIFNSKTMVGIANVNCTNRRKHGDDEEISDVTNKLGGKMRIQYSLYVGDQKDVIHTMYLRVPENSSAYEVMKLAQVVDHKYKFLQRDVSGHMYVYTIAGITNDPEAGKFWLLYTGDSYINGTIHHHTKSPDKFILGDGDHLILWYKTSHI